MPKTAVSVLPEYRASTDDPVCTLGVSYREWDARLMPVEGGSQFGAIKPWFGLAIYWHWQDYNVVVNGKEHKDLIWCYKYPTAESASIARHMYFYNEKVDIYIDGEKEEK